MDKIEIQNKKYSLMIYMVVSMITITFMFSCIFIIINDINQINASFNEANTYNNSCVQYKLIKDRINISVCIDLSINTTYVEIIEYYKDPRMVKYIHFSKLEFVDFMTYIPLIDWSIRNGQSV